MLLVASTYRGIRMKTIVHIESDLAYNKFELAIAERIRALTGPLFEVPTDGLFDSYLAGIPANTQHYNCNHCRRFIERFGGIVTIDKLGKVQSAIWASDHPTFEGEYPTFFRESTERTREAVERRRVSGVFLNADAVWGTPKTGEWFHMHGVPELKVVDKASQVIAEKKQDFIMLSRNLTDYSIDATRQALRVLEADALDRSEKTLGVARWLLALQESVDGRRSSDRQNLLWLAVATAPPGFCHIKTTMIGTLLDDIAAGMGYEEIAARWARKMHPLQYQRPTAPPRDGQIAAANKAIEEMKFAESLKRRFAKLEDVLVATWRPTPPLGVPAPSQAGGFFNSLKPGLAKTVEPLALRAIKMTWARFRDHVLPRAQELELEVPAHGSYFGMVTAVNSEAPPILQWDAEGRRNPVSWFFFHNGSPALQWDLRPLAWVKVSAVCDKPCHWYGGHDHHAPAAMLVLEGAHLTERESHGGFFPECLRTEFQEIRHVMEAYAKRNAVTGALDGTANGYALQKGDEYNVTVRVNGIDMYLIDRWE